MLRLFVLAQMVGVPKRLYLRLIRRSWKYWFKLSKAIAKALVNAHERGVKVQIIVDKKQRYARGSVVEYEWRSGVPTFVDYYHNAAHNKVVIIDGSIVITGSFNFTRAAEENNAENLLIVRSSSLAQRYIENWNYHKNHSGEYIVRGMASP